MTLESELHDEMLELYRRAGEATGYWGRRYLQAVRRHGGLARAKEMLRPRNASQRAGLDALINAGRPDLTLEALVIQPRFAPLFTPTELAEARRRLGVYAQQAASSSNDRERLYPDELEPGRTFPEGARKQVRVNAYERSAAARRASITHHGCRCAACGISFEEVYGDIGRDFIHVHHVVAMSTVSEAYRIDPRADLIPVCPNCHAMLHRVEPPLSIEALRTRIRHSRPIAELP